jgi:hypothetical protein
MRSYNFQFLVQCACAVLYCHLCLLWLYHNFLHKRHSFEEKKIIKCVFWFSLKLVWNLSYSEYNLLRRNHKFALVCTWSTRYSCRILMRLEFCRRILEKRSHIKFHENLPSAIRVVPCARTDRQTWWSQTLSQCRERDYEQYSNVYEVKILTGLMCC